MLQQTPQPQVITAHAADSLVDTIGINTHLHYTNTPYYTQFHSLIKPRLTDLNIRHIRDGAYTYPGINQNSFYYQRLRELATEDIQFNLITQTLDTPFNDPTNYTLLDEVYQWSGEAISAFEGVNEPDLQGIDNWVSATRQGQQQLYETVKGDPQLRHLPVIGPSVVTPAGRTRIGNLTAYTDYGNIHNYWGGRPPETTGWGPNGYGSLDWNLTAAQTVSGSDPIISTETGWQDGSQPLLNEQILDESIVARYLPRLLLTHFNAGVDRTFLYELLDQGGEQFGLLNGDGSPKPAYHSLKNFIDLFDDPGAAFTPTPLSLGLRGETQNVDHTLLQKRDGSFYLALWIGQSTDPNETDIADQRVTVTLPQSLRSQATIYTFLDDGSLSTGSVNLQSGQVTLTVKDNLRVLQLVPGDAAAPGPVSPTPTTPIPLDGTPAADQLSGTPRADLVRGYGGNDQLYGQAGNDRLLGGAGDDRLFGNGGNDQLYGQTGNDRLAGGPGNDELYGGDGQDWLSGTTGAWLGRGEQDRLIGGSGADRFVLGNGSGTFYDDGRPDQLGTEDFALIRGLGLEDRVQLGRGADYRLQANYALPNGETGYALWINRDEGQGLTDELIAIIQTGVSLSLEGSTFVWV